MTEHYVSIDLDDARAGKIAEVLGNKTCKKILGLISEKEMSQSELSESLKMPLNTLDYNIKKLVEAGFIEPNKGFLWSIKGKRILKYRAVNRKIIITPRFGLKGIIPMVVISGLAALGLNSWINGQKFVSIQAPDLLEKSRGAGNELGQTVASSADAGSVVNGVASASGSLGNSGVDIVANVSGSVGNAGLWFMLGALFVLLLIVVWNWRKIW